MHFPDLGTKTQIDSGNHIRAIGWLSADHPFPIGEVPADFATRLRAICDRWSDGLESLHWPVAAGAHQCELCQQCRSSGNIGVPAGNILFVAPQMVAHYVDSHRYKPPEEFVEAVRRCPAPGTDEYTLAVSTFRTINVALARTRDLFERRSRS